MLHVYCQPVYFRCWRHKQTLHSVVSYVYYLSLGFTVRQLAYALSWDVALRQWIICTRRFETEWQSHIQGSKFPVTSEPGRLDIRHQSPGDSAPHFRRAETSYIVVILTNTVCDKCVNVLMPTGSGYVRSIPRCSCYGVHWIWFPDDLPQEIRIRCNWLQPADCFTKCSVVYSLQWLLLSWEWWTLHWHQHYQVTVQDSLFIKTRVSWTWARPSAFYSQQG